MLIGYLLIGLGAWTYFMVDTRKVEMPWQFRAAMLPALLLAWPLELLGQILAGRRQ